MEVYNINIIKRENEAHLSRETRAAEGGATPRHVLHGPFMTELTLRTLPNFLRDVFQVSL